MATPSIPRYVALPAPLAPKYGLLSVSSMLDAGDPHTMLGIQAEPPRCDAAFLSTALWCGDEEGDVGAKQYTGGVPLIVGSPFNVFGAYECNPVGRPLAEAEERARMHLRTGRERAIEAAFQTGSEGNEPSLVGTAQDITPVGGPVGLIDAVALLEGWMGAETSGVGVIHMSRRLATHAIAQDLLCKACATAGGRLTTGLGTLVAAGAGYVDGAAPTQESPPADPGIWLYATGAVHVWASGVGIMPSPVRQGVNTSTNVLTVLAEQQFVVAFECGAVAIQVDPDSLPFAGVSGGGGDVVEP